MMSDFTLDLNELFDFADVTEFVYDMNPELLHFKFLKSLSPSKTLVVYFHGAMERSKRAIPSYYPIDHELNAMCHQISICDPTMTDRKGFPLSWYVGHEEFNCQKKLLSFFQLLKKSLGVEKVIFTGSSGGGFAALYYSFFDSDSVALPMVPQTSIEKYHRPKAFDIYSKYCWSKKDYSYVSNLRCLNICDLYRDGFNNTVVYIQSSGDSEHFARQLLPFLESIRNTPMFKENFVLENSFYGKHGHSGVITKRDYTPWLKSLIENDLNDKKSILEGFFLHKSRLSSGEVNPKDLSESVFSEKDVLLQHKIQNL